VGKSKRNERNHGANQGSHIQYFPAHEKHHTFAVAKVEVHLKELKN